jgi:hypothetical protein
MFAAAVVLVRLSRSWCETIRILSGIKVAGKCSDVAAPEGTGRRTGSCGIGRP